MLGQPHDEVRREGAPGSGVVLARTILARALEELVVPSGRGGRGGREETLRLEVAQRMTPGCAPARGGGLSG
jgi:hypothetical protein